MIYVKTPMMLLVETKEELEKLADENIQEDDKRECYKEAVNDMFNALKEYF